MVEMANQELGVTSPIGVRIPRARRAPVDPNVFLVDAIHIADNEDRLGNYADLSDTEQAKLLRMASGICSAVFEMGANPGEAAEVAVDTLCAAAGIIPQEGRYGQ